MKKIIAILFLATLLAQFDIEGRWHIVGYEDAVMYQFVDNEPFANAGNKYTIYSIDGHFDDLEGDMTGGTPHPYSIVDDVITIDYHFGNVVSYQMNFLCNEQVVELISDEYGVMTLFREYYDYSQCNQILDECFDFTNIDFGPCFMLLGVGLQNNQCNYISGCGWTNNGIDYTDYFFDSIEECEENCSQSQCQDGFVEINDMCFHSGDLSIIQEMIDNSYQSNIDLDCYNDSIYCGSPNPYMDSQDNWGWIAYDGVSYDMPGNENGIVEPLELGIQEWENGRLTSFMCGAYIYCQLSGPIPDNISDLTELEVFRVEGNYFSGTIPESICDLDINYNDYLAFDVSYNQLCGPYPDCINSEQEFWGQYDSECINLGDLNADNVINVLDIVQIVSLILNSEYEINGDYNEDGILNVIDVVQIISIILN